MIGKLAQKKKFIDNLGICERERTKNWPVVVMASWWDTKSWDPYALNIRSDFCKGEHKAWIEAPELRIQEGPKRPMRSIKVDSVVVACLVHGVEPPSWETVRICISYAKDTKAHVLKEELQGLEWL